MGDNGSGVASVWREWETRAEAYHRYVNWYFQTIGLFLSAAVLVGAYAFLRGESGTAYTPSVAAVLIGLWFLLVGSHPFVHRYAVDVGNRVRELEDELAIPERRRTGPILEAVTLGGAVVWTVLGVITVVTAPPNLFRDWWGGSPLAWKAGFVLVMLATPVIAYGIAERFWPIVHRFGFVGIRNFG